MKKKIIIAVILGVIIFAYLLLRGQAKKQTMKLKRTVKL